MTCLLYTCDVYIRHHFEIAVLVFNFDPVAVDLMEVSDFFAEATLLGVTPLLSVTLLFDVNFLASFPGAIGLFKITRLPLLPASELSTVDDIWKLLLIPLLPDVTDVFLPEAL